MLIKILLFITLFLKFTAAHAHSENQLPNLITVKNYLNALDNVRIDFRQCNENEEKIKLCNHGNMYITRNFENKSKTRMRIDYEDPNSSIIIDKDNIMYCDHDLEETSYFSEDILFFKLLTANDNKLQKYFIADQSDAQNFVFHQSLNNGKEALITLTFAEPTKLQQITIEQDDDTTYILDKFIVNPYDDKDKFSMRNPYSSRKRNR
jgi:outer membrane lipoprotein-sorting protein